MSVTRFYGGESSLDFRSLVGDCLTRAANRRRGEGVLGLRERGLLLVRGLTCIHEPLSSCRNS